DVRGAGPCVRLPLVRHPLVPELRVRAALRRPDPCARADSRPRRDEGAPRRRRSPPPLLGPGPPLPGPWRLARPRPAPTRPTALRAPPARARAGDRDRAADRHHPRRRAPLALRGEGLALPQPRCTESLTASQGAAATPAGAP